MYLSIYLYIWKNYEGGVMKLLTNGLMGEWMNEWIIFFPEYILQYMICSLINDGIVDTCQDLGRCIALVLREARPSIVKLVFKTEPLVQFMYISIYLYIWKNYEGGVMKLLTNGLMGLLCQFIYFPIYIFIYLSISIFIHPSICKNCEGKLYIYLYI